ncbi:Eco29kI [Bartonella choladocola]|uniref:Eco29kI family restriction endonuclease n=1 Tax=Bartonella choladocola TaxID=2750995 RepID=UPI00399825AA
MTNDNIVPFNPLDKRHLGESVGQAMLRRPVFPLKDLEYFKGAGIYAIYYCGKFPAYQIISEHNDNHDFKWPIYVGKAIPAGGRKGNLSSKNVVGTSLWSRLKEHAQSVMSVSNLSIDDFYCRYLVVDDIWIPLGETLLIAKFNPLWNVLIDGFGNHNPGKGRHQGMRPRWDILHPGREWADKCNPRPETAKQLSEEIVNYLMNNPPIIDNIMVTPNSTEYEE